MLHAAAACALLHSGAGGAVLEWNNGETVEGGILSGTEKELVWRVDPPRFGGPLGLRLDVLRSIDLLPQAGMDWSKDGSTQEPLGIRLDDGTRLFGSISGMDARNVTIQAARFGTVKVARSAITSLQRMSGAGLLATGPGGRGAWKTENDAKKHLWRHVPGGYLRQTGWNDAARLEILLPERLELRLRLRSQARPDFRIELVSEARQRCVIETWDNEIVLQGGDFTALSTIPEARRHVTLGIFWDRQAGLCSVFDGEGKKLTHVKLADAAPTEPQKPAEAENPVPQAGGLVGAIAGLLQMKMARAREAASNQDSGTSRPGVLLKNKGLDLTLEELMLREWNGSLPAEITDAAPRVELMDGRVLNGAIVKADASTFTIQDGHGELSLPWSALAAARQARDNVSGSWFTRPQAALSYSDGMWVRGELVSMMDGRAEFRTSFATEPVSLELKGAARLDLRVPVPEGAAGSTPLAAFDKLTIDGKALHGRLEADGGPMPRWKPIGASKAVAVLPAKDMQIDRAEASLAVDRAEALFYLKNGDIVPGRFRSMDQGRLDLESPLFAGTSFRPEELHAVHFSGEPLNPSGFQDKGWRIIRGTKQQVSTNGQQAGLQPGGSLAHPTFSQVSELSFRLEGNGFSSMRARLFTNGADANSKSLNLLFGLMGNEAIFGIETRGDQMDNQNRVASPRSVPVRITIKERLVEVFINGVPVRQVTVTPQMRSGSGLILEPFSLWGNGEREVKITHFEARSGPGQIALPNVDPKAREHALLIPRFRRESPPAHVLVATNGDLLRGVIEAATTRHFAVRSGLENVQVPVDRVSAVIWLEKPDEKPARAAAPGTHTLLLSNGGRLALHVSRFDQDMVTGSAPRLGEVRVPAHQIVTLRTTPPEESALMRSFREWKLAYTPEPVLPETGGESSPMLTKEAPAFTLPLLGGGEFDLAKEKGKVVVLDFWATWCGPCVKSLPGMIAKMAEFDPAKVRFIAVNQAEPADQVKSFLATRGWRMEVALDGFQRVGQQFKVEGIPHTVLIDTQGRVSFVKTGYSADGAEKLSEQVRKLIK